MKSVTIHTFKHICSSAFPHPLLVWQWSQSGTVCFQWRSTASSPTSMEASLSSEPVSAPRRSLKWEEPSTCDGTERRCRIQCASQERHYIPERPLPSIVTQEVLQQQCRSSVWQIDALWIFTVYDTIKPASEKFYFSFCFSFSPCCIWTTFTRVETQTGFSWRCVWFNRALLTGWRSVRGFPPR